MGQRGSTTWNKCGTPGWTRTSGSFRKRLGYLGSPGSSAIGNLDANALPGTTAAENQVLVLSEKGR
jgi:hypothetical protein